MCEDDGEGVCAYVCVSEGEGESESVCTYMCTYSIYVRTYVCE